MHKIAMVGCVVMWAAAVSAQPSSPAAPSNTSSPTTDVSSIGDFRALFQERLAVVDQMRDLQKTIDELESKTKTLPDATTLERDLARTKRDLDIEQKRRAPDEARLESLQRYVDTTNESLEIVRSAAPLLAKARADRERANGRLIAVETRIASLFDAARDVNKFRTNVTFTFGVLVFVVIVGFYIIAWYKQGVATTIFSGAMGMQFVTLFLIVIAIILFGIMGTLGDKELAALLGGLSGYILGRAETRREAPADTDVGSPR